MSRNPKPISKGPAPAKTDTPDPASSLPQVKPDTTDAASAEAKAAAEAAAASVDPNLPKGEGAVPNPVNAPDGTAPSQNGPDPSKDDASPVPPVTPPVTPPAPPAEAKTRKPAQPVVLRVKGPANGRWRAGRHFTPEPVDIPMADLSDEDLLKLKGDPALSCTVIGTSA